MSGSDIKRLEEMISTLIQMVGGMNARVEESASDIKLLAADLSGVKADLNEVKADLNGVKADLNEVKADLNGVKADLNEVKADLNGVKADLNEVKADLSEVKADLNEVKVDLQETKSILHIFRSETDMNFKKLDRRLKLIESDLDETMVKVSEQNITKQ